MFSSDHETGKLKYLPGLQDFVDQFHNNYATAAEQYKANGMYKYTGKCRQVCMRYVCSGKLITILIILLIIKMYVEVEQE